MILRFYRRGAEGARTQISRGQRTGTGGYAARQTYADQRACTDWRACAECAAEGTGGRQLLLDFEEDRICIVREVRRNGCIGGSRPWSSPEAPEGPESTEGLGPDGLWWPQQGSAPGNNDCA